MVNLAKTAKKWDKSYMLEDDLSKMLTSVLGDQYNRVKEGEYTFTIPHGKQQIPLQVKGHMHLAPELVIQIDGVSRLEYPSSATKVHKGEMHLTPAWLPHNEYGEEPREKFRNAIFAFQDSLLVAHVAQVDTGRSKPRIVKHIARPTVHGNRIISCLESAGASVAAAQKSGAEHCKGMLLTALELMLKAFQERGAGTPADILIDQCTTLVSSHLDNPELSVKQLAGWLGCNADYLSWRFHHVNKESLIHYIHQRRIQRAGELLLSTDYSIKQISWVCGFRDQGYFSRVFRRIMGMSPRIYKKDRSIL